MTAVAVMVAGQAITLPEADKRAGAVVLDVPGKVWDDSCDPRATGVPGAEGWPDPLRDRRGHGRRYRYIVSPAVAEDILSHVVAVFESRQGYAEAAADRAPYLSFFRRLGIEVPR